MAEITLEYIARQIQRVQYGVDIMRRDLGRMAGDMATIKDVIATIKAETTALRADFPTMRSEIAALRQDMRAGFDRLDARLRPVVQRKLSRGRADTRR